MAQSGNPKPGGLSRIVTAVPVEDIVVLRQPRREVTGIAYNMQRTSLVLDAADGKEAQRHRCQITNTSEGGYCVTLRIPGGLGGLFRPGMRLNLEPAHEKPVRVEVRWVKADRLGLRRLRPGEFQGQPMMSVVAEAPAPAPEPGPAAVPGQRPRKPRLAQAQKGRLILDEPDSMGVKIHHCRLVNLSDEGFCVQINVWYPMPELAAGTKLDLEYGNRRRTRMEVRWYKNNQVGLRIDKPAAGAAGQ